MTLSFNDQNYSLNPQNSIKSVMKSITSKIKKSIILEFTSKTHQSKSNVHAYQYLVPLKILNLPINYHFHVIQTKEKRDNAFLCVISSQTVTAIIDSWIIIDMKCDLNAHMVNVCLQSMDLILHYHNNEHKVVTIIAVMVVICIL